MKPILNTTKTTKDANEICYTFDLVEHTINQHTCPEAKAYYCRQGKAELDLAAQ